jgi:hypothetical protein
MLERYLDGALEMAYLFLALVVGLGWFFLAWTVGIPYVEAERILLTHILPPFDL